MVTPRCARNSRKKWGELPALKTEELTPFVPAIPLTLPGDGQTLSRRVRPRCRGLCGSRGGGERDWLGIASPLRGRGRRQGHCLSAVTCRPAKAGRLWHWRRVRGRRQLHSSGNGGAFDETIGPHGGPSTMLRVPSLSGLPLQAPLEGHAEPVLSSVEGSCPLRDKTAVRATRRSPLQRPLEGHAPSCPFPPQPAPMEGHAPPRVGRVPA